MYYISVTHLDDTTHWGYVVMPLQRFASEKEGDREVQRTMLELLNQLDGFSSTSEVKVRWEEEDYEEEVTVLSLCEQVIAATNRVDTLDPALLRSGIASAHI